MLEDEFIVFNDYLNRKHKFGNSLFESRDYFEKKKYQCVLGNIEANRAKILEFLEGEGLSKMKQCQDLDIVYKVNKGGNIIFAAQFFIVELLKNMYCFVYRIKTETKSRKKGLAKTFI